MLRDERQGTRYSAPNGGFDSVGTALDQGPQAGISLMEYLSYDEMALGALLGVSCPTHFINSGSRVRHPPSALQPQALWAIASGL